MTNQEQFAFKALADPTRRQILLHLSAGDRTIGELVSEFSMTRAAVKKHLDVLTKGQMVSVHPRGRERINRLQPEGIRSVTDWLSHFDRFWDDKLSVLQHVIESELSATSVSSNTGSGKNSGKKSTAKPTRKRKSV